jgi:hypothetical protein
VSFVTDSVFPTTEISFDLRGDKVNMCTIVEAKLILFQDASRPSWKPHFPLPPPEHKGALQFNKQLITSLFRQS